MKKKKSKIYKKCSGIILSSYYILVDSIDFLGGVTNKCLKKYIQNYLKYGI
jgi:hypothetical protein